LLISISKTNSTIIKFCIFNMKKHIGGSKNISRD
jgi:hypothetical protein